MTAVEIRQKAESIVSRGNGFGVPCGLLLGIPDEGDRAAVWAEIIKIGQEQNAEYDEVKRKGIKCYRIMNLSLRSGIKFIPLSVK